MATVSKSISSISHGTVQVCGDELKKLNFFKCIKYKFKKSYREDIDAKVNTFVFSKLKEVTFETDVTIEAKREYLQKQISFLSLTQFNREQIKTLSFYNDLKVEVIANISPNGIEEKDADFWAKMAEGVIADWSGVKCKRNASGTSGSYFVRNLAGEKIGIFKPVSESPHAKNNPHLKIRIRNKVQKILRMTSRCIDEQEGHKAEEYASRMSERFGWTLVPKTRVARFASSSLSIKNSFEVGSFQEFIPNAHDGFQHFNIPSWLDNSISKYFLPDENKDTVKKLSQKSFEQFALLQYLLCNTDSNLGNMLFVKVEKKYGPDIEIEKLEADIAKHKDDVKMTNEKEEDAYKLYGCDAWNGLPKENPDGWLNKRGLHLWDNLSWANEVISKESIQCVFDNKAGLIEDLEKLHPGRKDIMGLFMKRITALENAKEGLKWRDLARADLDLQTV